MTTDSWLPDFIARWYDELLPSLKDKSLRQRLDEPTVARRADAMRAQPNDEAARLNEWIDSANFLTRPHRLYHALRAVSRALRRAGMIRPLEYRSSQWREVRMHWRATGNLLRHEAGLLLPQHHIPFAWAPQRSYSYSEPQDHFDAFVRWRADDVPRIATHVMHAIDPVDALELELRVAAVPLVADVTEFHWEPIDTTGDLRFRVSLRDERAALDAALHALETAAADRCDVVVFPELCFTPEGQKALGNAIAGVSSRHGGYPWLVVAGTAHTPLGFGDFHNRAVMFDSSGREILHYNKMHAYRMSAREQTRYALSDVFNQVDRTEDISEGVVVSLAETPIGRVGILICEDLSHTYVYTPVVQRLAIDWLLVPVLDGSQVNGRWTQTRAQTYADLGAGVLVVTSQSIVRAHCASVPALPQSVGLLVRPGRPAEMLLAPAKPDGIIKAILQ
jgi:predicted amidohydrolase